MVDKNKTGMRCGLCDRRLRDDETWNVHVDGAEHQKNLNDPVIMRKAFDDSQSEIIQQALGEADGKGKE